MSPSFRSKGNWRLILATVLLGLQLGGVHSSDGASAAAPAAAKSNGSATTNAAAVSQAPLAPFSHIFSCLPFSLLVQPTSGNSSHSQSSGPAYSLRLDTTDANITAAFDYNITGDTLHLGLAPNITTNSCASVVVGLPADALQEVRASVPIGFSTGFQAGYLATDAGGNAPAVVIDGPFVLPSLTAALTYSGQGDPRLVIRGGRVDTLTVAANRCTCNTTLFASGTFRDVRLHAENQECPEFDQFDANTAPCTIPAARVATVTECITVNGSVAVVTPNASLAIEGVAGPVVTANAGTCNLRLPPSGQLSAQPCLITRSPPVGQAADAVGAIAAAAGAFNQTCGFDKQQEMFQDCPANVSAFDAGSGLQAAVAAAVPLPTPLAEQALGELLAHARQLAVRAAAGDAEAAANLTAEAADRNDVDLLVPLTVIALSEGGQQGALAAFEETKWGCTTRFGCRDSFQRAMAVLINQNDTAAIRTALEVGAQWEGLDPLNKGLLSGGPRWVAGAIQGECTGNQWCTADFGGVHTPNATALMLAAGLSLAGGYFRDAVTHAAVSSVCPGCVSCWKLPPLSCEQVRAALGEAVVLAPQLGYGSGQEVMRNAVAASDPEWQACVFGAAAPPAAEVAAAAGRQDCHP